MRDDSLKLPFASSLVVHLLVLALASALVQNGLRRQEFQPIGLVDLPPSAPPVSVKKVEPDTEVKKPLPAKPEKIKETKAAAKPEIVKIEKPVPAPAALPKDESAKAAETKIDPGGANGSSPSIRPRRESKAAAAKPAPEISLAKAMSVSFREAEPPAVAAARPLRGWAAAPARLAYPRRPSCEPTAKPSRFKPCAQPIRRWRCAPDSKAM